MDGAGGQPDHGARHDGVSGGPHSPS